MKIKFVLSVLFLLMISCNQRVDISIENVTGKWKVSKFENDIPNVPEDIRKAGEKEFLSSIYTLNDDFSMQMHSDYFTDGAFGRWELNPDAKEISMFYNYDTISGNETYNIVSLSKNKMVLHQLIDANEYDGFVQLTLEK